MDPDYHIETRNGVENVPGLLELLRSELDRKGQVAIDLELETPEHSNPQQKPWKGKAKLCIANTWDRRDGIVELLNLDLTMARPKPKQRRKRKAKSKCRVLSIRRTFVTGIRGNLLIKNPRDEGDESGETWTAKLLRARDGSCFEIYAERKNLEDIEHGVPSKGVFLTVSSVAATLLLYDRTHSGKFPYEGQATVLSVGIHTQQDKTKQLTD